MNPVTDLTETLTQLYRNQSPGEAGATRRAHVQTRTFASLPKSSFRTSRTPACPEARGVIFVDHLASTSPLQQYACAERCMRSPSGVSPSHRPQSGRRELTGCGRAGMPMTVFDRIQSTLPFEKEARVMSRSSYRCASGIGVLGGVMIHHHATWCYLYEIDKRGPR